MPVRHVPIYLINIVIHTVVYTFFIAYAVGSRRKSESRKIFTPGIILYDILLCIWVLLFFEQEAPFSQYGIYALILWIAATILCGMVFIKDSPFMLCFLILVTASIQNNVIAFAKIINSFGILPVILGFEHLAYLLLTVVLLIAYIPAMWLIYIRLFKKLIDTGVDYAYWKYLWILPASFIILLHSSSLGGIISAETYGIRDLIALLAMNVAGVSSYIVSLNMLIRTYDSMTAVQRAQLAAEQLEMQKGEYAHLMRHIKETARQRHDWRHHLLTISGLAKRKDYETLDCYLRDYTTDYLNDTEAPVCAHRVVNIILRHFIQRAVEQGIEVDADVQISGSLAIPDSDLCVVLGNLMENAVEACCMQESGRRFISIRAAQTQKQLLIIVRNSFAIAPEQAGGVFRSTKRSGEGIGVSSVRSIAEAGNGCLLTDSEDGVFTARALLNIP